MLSEAAVKSATFQTSAAKFSTTQRPLIKSNASQRFSKAQWIEIGFGSRVKGYSFIKRHSHPTFL